MVPLSVGITPCQPQAVHTGQGRSRRYTERADAVRGIGHDNAVVRIAAFEAVVDQVGGPVLPRHVIWLEALARPSVLPVLVATETL